MKKDFDTWNKKKKNLHYHKRRAFFKPREVWFAHLGANIGFEQDGSGKEQLRPVVILKKFNNEICWVVPLTRTEKMGEYYMPVSFQEDSESRVILSQLRLLDTKRLKYHAGYLKEDDFEELKKRLRDLLS